jgi:AbiV family abortive infection protein
MKAGLFTQAAVIFSFAVEKFGKAALLRAAYESGVDPVVVEGFYDHKVKLDAAAIHIPAQHLRLTKGGFRPNAMPRGFQMGTQASLSARLSGLYVDWDEGEGWQYGVEVDPATLAESIEGVQAALARAMVDWT